MPNVKAEMIAMRDSAVQAASPAHSSIKFEQSVYKNDGAYDRGATVGYVASRAGEQLYPKATEVVNEFSGHLETLVPRVQLEADKSSLLPDSALWVDVLQRWYDMIEDVDGEGELMRVAIHHNSVGGMAVRKVVCNEGVVTAPAISPLAFSVDPDCDRINLSNAEYVVHTTHRSTRYVKRHYPMFIPKKEQKQNRIDEIWVRRRRAKEIGIDVDASHREMFRGVLINDGQVALVQSSPWIWPDFPFACWRNFLDYGDDGKSAGFWGFGFPKLLWPQQKMLDHLLANLVVIVNNQAVGRFMAPEGALKTDQVLPIHNLIIEYDKEITNIAEILHLPPDQIPPALFQFVQYVVDVMEVLSGATKVFTGDQPNGNLSGRAIAALQTAAARQAISIVRGMNEFRGQIGRIKATIIQQTAERPISPTRWRGGIDLPDKFPKEARHVGFAVKVADSSALPQTPAGRAEIARLLAELGHPLTLQALLEHIGLDRGYGMTEDKFQTMPTGSGGQSNEAALMGAETEPGISQGGQEAQ